MHVVFIVFHYLLQLPILHVLLEILHILLEILHVLENLKYLKYYMLEMLEIGSIGNIACFLYKTVLTICLLILPSITRKHLEMRY